MFPYYRFALSFNLFFFLIPVALIFPKKNFVSLIPASRVKVHSDFQFFLRGDLKVACILLLHGHTPVCGHTPICPLWQLPTGAGTGNALFASVPSADKLI